MLTGVNRKREVLRRTNQPLRTRKFARKWLSPIGCLANLR